MPIEIRPANESDFEGIMTVARASLGFAYRDIYDEAHLQEFLPIHYGPKRLSELLVRARLGSTLFNVAVDGTEVVGFACAGQTAGGLELHRLYAHPAVIGKGIGKRLLESVEAFARSCGFTTYYCFVHSRNEVAKQFYLRAGFRHLERRDREEDWWMHKRLEPRWKEVPRLLRRIAARV